ncbi:MAG: hypothetical protein P8K77_09655 [Polaribacter sp.]|nr:hypothetical protein [Polaribacter sp.]
MKTRNIVLVISFVLLSSCIVKSLHPFYTKETIVSDTQFLGQWEDDDGALWEVAAFSELILEGKPIDSLSKKDSKEYYKFQHAYFIERTKRNEKTTFLATPFKINGQLFLDFIPFEIDGGFTTILLKIHLVATHSLVKYDVLPNGEISFKWLSENKVAALFKEKKIKIKHEKVGLLDDKYLLTAKPEELQKFIKKYMTSNDNEKWKTDTEFTLTKINATP